MYDNRYHGYEEPTVWPYYLIGGIIIFIVFCLLANTFQTLWKCISEDLRTMSPEQSWLIIIPLFGVIWMFYLIFRLGEALKEEFSRKNIVEFESAPGLGIGWAFSFAILTAQLVSFIDEPVMAFILYLAATTLLIIFWIRLAGFINKLNYNPKTGFEQQQSQPFQQMPPAPQQQWPYYPPQQNFPEPPPYFPPPQQQENEWDRWRPKQ